ncbi:MAG TPA: DEAD/DEAH box helicase, partial [Bacteroidales bacterium]|nr:DEAD/DEAH box helicase [Bacteroidales bacterium]
MEGIDANGYEAATPIQEQAIPAILSGRDLIACAQTGTGKTAAFLLPLTNNIITSEQNHRIKCMVIEPTRELAIQVDQQMQGFSYFT